jgi:ABC-type phosphate transport system permease subunit
MEAIVFGVIALIAFNPKQQRIVPEPAKFQPFDLRSLGHLHDAKILRAGHLIGIVCAPFEL